MKLVVFLRLEQKAERPLSHPCFQARLTDVIESADFDLRAFRQKRRNLFIRSIESNFNAASKQL
jgi:hypothetical protein